MENLFAIGATIQLNWTLNSIAGEAFSLSGHTYQLHISCGNENALATGVTHSGNVLTWTFRPTAAWKRGAYTLWLDVFANGTKIVTVTYPNAFHIVSRTASDVQSVAVQTGSATLNLVSSLDFYRFAPVVPVVGEDGYWYVNGQKVIDENEEYVLSSHTVEYDPTTKNIIIDKDRVDSEGNSIQQTVTAIPDALSAMQSSYDAAEGSSDESTAGDGSRWGTFKSGEAARQTAAENAETARQSAASAAEGSSAGSVAGDGSRWGTFKSGEAARQTAAENAEGSKNGSVAGDGTRWGQFKQAEAARDASAQEEASAASQAAEAANAAATRANNAAAAAEHMVEIQRGPAGVAPVIGQNGNWWTWDDEEDDYVDTNLPARGADGLGLASVDNPVPADGTIILTLSNGDTVTLDLNHSHPGYFAKVAESVQPSGGFLPDVAYKLGELTGSTLTFELASPVTGNLNHYFFVFSTGSTAPSTVNWPSSVTAWGGNCIDENTGEPELSASKRYEVSIMDGIGYISEV